MNLKPCPFCGAEAIIHARAWTGHGEGGTLYLAQCTGCNAEVPSKAPMYPYHQEKPDGQAGAIEAWNKREVVCILPDHGSVSH